MSENEPKLTPTFKDIQEGMAGTAQFTGTMTAPLAFPASRVLGGIPFQQLPPPIPQTKREKVAIIGTAPSSRSLAPYGDMNWDIWVCSPGNMNTCPRVDAWFEIHKNLHWPEYVDAYGKNYIEWLNKQTGFPIYMQDQSYVPHALSFPKDEMIKKFGGNFFTSSFAWMMALAIDRGYKEIGLFGVDMASKDEYIQQRQAFFYWLEKAEALGIKVTIPPESDLLQPPGLYGYSDATRFGRKMNARKQELLSRIAHIERVEIPRLEGELKNLKDTVLYLKGAVEDQDYVLSIWPRIGHGEDSESVRTG